MLNNEDGKSKIRARERILISPLQPVVTDPQQFVQIAINKMVGMSSKHSYCNIAVNKNFFVAGEIAYINVTIDNRSCHDACSLIVNHTHKLKVMLEGRKSSKFFVNKSEKYFLAHAGQMNSLLLQFQIGAKRKKCRKISNITHAELYH